MKKFWLTVAGLLAMGLVGLVWWAFSPLLFDKEVHDEIPTALREQLENQPNNQPIDTSIEGPFSISGTLGHPASGEVEIIHSPEGRLAYYTNYAGTNGPDLYIYLAKDLEAEEFVNLGAHKGNRGNIIYHIPDNVDLSEYRYILTWCRAFGILFDYAKIN